VGREFASPRADLIRRITPAGELRRFYGGEGPELQSNNKKHLRRSASESRLSDAVVTDLC